MSGVLRYLVVAGVSVAFGVALSVRYERARARRQASGPKTDRAWWLTVALPGAVFTLAALAIGVGTQ
jgi:hypothetical protein